MATIISLGNAAIPEDRANEYVSRVGTAVTEGLGLPPELRSVYALRPPVEQTTRKEKPEITYFIFTAPDKTTDQKRAVIKNLKDFADDFFGPDEVTVVVIFKIHDDENVGVNGVLRYDAKRQAAQ